VAVTLSSAASDAFAQNASPTAAPEGAVFEGQVVDSVSGEPIPGVLIRTDAGPEALTDQRGAFRITGLPQGRRLFALLSSDCRITWGEIDVIEAIPRRERLRLPPAFGAASEEQRRAEDDRKRTGGKRVEAAEIDRMRVSSATELIRRVAPAMVGPLSGDPGAASAIRSGRARSFMPEDPPVVVIDGVRITGSDRALYDLRASDIAVLEVLPGAVAGWEFGSAGAAGVIKITLRRGVATGTPERRAAPECVVPAFPRR
jgi:hypothetical protein